MGKVAETVKSSAAVSVEFVFVVVRHSRYKSLDSCSNGSRPNAGTRAISSGRLEAN